MGSQGRLPGPNSAKNLQKFNKEFSLKAKSFSELAFAAIQTNAAKIVTGHDDMISRLKKTFQQN
jgi:hypothetical protein